MGNPCNLWSPARLMKCYPCLHLSSKTLRASNSSTSFKSQMLSLVVEDILVIIQKWLKPSCQKISSPQTRSIRNSWTRSTLKSQILFQNPVLWVFSFSGSVWSCFCTPGGCSPPAGDVCTMVLLPSLISGGAWLCLLLGSLTQQGSALPGSPRDPADTAWAGLCVWTHCLCRISPCRVPAPCLRDQGKSHILLSWIQ